MANSENTSTPDLLGVPSELRLIIYSFLQPKPINQQFEVTGKIVEANEPDARTRDFARLSRSCTKIYIETNDLFYQDSKAYVRAQHELPPAPQMRARKWYWNRITHFLHSLNQMRYVSLTVTLRCDVLTSTGIRFLCEMRMVLKALQGSDKLAEFCFVTVPCTCRRLEEAEIEAEGDDHSAKDRELARAVRVIAQLEKWLLGRPTPLGDHRNL